jgi:antitoxin YefM
MTQRTSTKAVIQAYPDGMQTLPISKVKDKLNEYVDVVSTTREHVVITKNGEPTAVLVGADEWESLQETLFWMSRPGILDNVAQADRDLAAGNTFSEAQIREEFGVPRRPST